MTVLSSHPGRRATVILRIGIVLQGFVLAACAVATDDTRPAPATAPPVPAGSVAAPADEPPTCVHGCLRWGKLCNVDPRGVYKCQRRCERFGEICE